MSSRKSGETVAALRAAVRAADGRLEPTVYAVATAQLGEEDAGLCRREWQQQAEWNSTLARRAEARGWRTSAREAFLRAYGYHRMASMLSSDAAADAPGEAFRRALALADHASEELRIPFEREVLHGHLFRPAGSGSDAPTFIFTPHLCARYEDAYGRLAPAGLRRGFNVVLFDGPGYGRAFTQHNLHLRPDWERVIGAAADHLADRAGIDPARITLGGAGFGGLLSARAAAKRTGFAGLVMIDGYFDFREVLDGRLPPHLTGLFDDGADELLAQWLDEALEGDPELMALFELGARSLGSDSMSHFVRQARDYTLADVAQNILCPTFVIQTNRRHAAAGQCVRLAGALPNAREQALAPVSAEPPPAIPDAGGWAAELAFDMLADLF